MKVISRNLLIAISVVFLSACSGGSVGTSQEVQSDKVTISHSDGATIGEGGEVELKVIVKNDAGKVVESSADNPVVVSWESENNNIASVDDTGLVSGISVGTTKVTASVKDPDGEDTISVSTTITVNPNDVGSVILSPARISIDAEGTRVINANAIDTFGSAINLECGDNPDISINNEPTLPLLFDEVVTATYDANEKTINATGIADGLGLITVNCGGYDSSPVVIGVKQSSNIASNKALGPQGEGFQTALAINDNAQQHLAVYDEQQGKLSHWVHDTGNWDENLLTGNGDYGRAAAIILDPSTRRPIICAINDVALSCWTQNSNGFFSPQTVDQNITGGTDYIGTISLSSAENGSVYVAYYNQAEQAAKLATSNVATRNDWVLNTVASGEIPYISVSTAPDNSPRVALQYVDQAYFGSPSDDTLSNWGYEKIGADGELSGENIQLVIGNNYQPQVIYKKDDELIYRVKSEGSWAGSNLGGIAESSQLVLAIDDRNLPRAIYQSTDSGTINYVYREKNARIGSSDRWRTAQPTITDSINPYAGLSIDSIGRAHIAYYSESGESLNYYVEPYFFDYSTFDIETPDGIENTTVASPVFIADVKSTVSSSSNRISLEWDEIEGASGYRLYWYGNNKNNPTPEIIDVTETNFESNTGIVTGKIYYYEIAAIIDSIEAAKSAQYKVSVDFPTPQNVHIEATENANTISWSAVEGSAFYTVYWSESLNFEDHINAVDLDSSETSYRHMLTSTNKFHYFVTASDANAESKPSDAVSALAQPEITSVINNAANDSIEVSWNEIEGATHYHLYYSDQQTFNIDNVHTIETPYTNLKFTNQTGKKTLLLAVRAMSEVSTSLHSGIVTTTKKPIWETIRVTDLTIEQLGNDNDPHTKFEWDAATALNGDIYIESYVKSLPDYRGNSPENTARFLKFTPHLEKIQVLPTSYGVYQTNVKEYTGARTGVALIAAQDAILSVGGYPNDYWTFNDKISTEFVLPTNVATHFQIDSQTWSNISPLATSRGRFGAIEKNGYIYLFGGYDNYRFPTYSGTNPIEPLATIENYHIATGETGLQGYMPNARVDFAAIELNGKVYLIGGDNVNANTVESSWSATDIYDMEQNLWKVGARMPTWRRSFVAQAIDNKIYVFGGINRLNEKLQTVEAYNVETNTWETKSDLPELTTPKIGQRSGRKIYLFDSNGTDIVVYDPDADDSGKPSVVEPTTPEIKNISYDSGYVYLDWSAETFSDAYQIRWRQLDSDTQIVQTGIFTVTGSTKASHRVPEHGFKYEYEISSLVGESSSTASEVRAINVSLEIVPNFRKSISADIQNTAVLSWDEVSGATTYTIFRKMSADEVDELVTLPASTTNYTLASNANSGNHYAIRANTEQDWATSPVSKFIAQLDAPTVNENYEVNCNVHCDDVLQDIAWFTLGENDNVGQNLIPGGSSLLPSNSNPPVYILGARSESVGLHLDGTTSYSTSMNGNLSIDQQDFTIEVWLRPEAWERPEGSILPIVGTRTWAGDGFFLYLENQKLVMETSEGQQIIKQYLSDTLRIIGRWHHLVISVDAEKWGGGKVYWDGFLVHGFDHRISGKLIDSASYLTIGDSPNYYDEDCCFTGDIDELRIYQTALTHQQVINNFSSRDSYTQITKNVPDNDYLFSWQRVAGAENYDIYYEDHILGAESIALNKLIFLKSTTDIREAIPHPPSGTERSIYVQAKSMHSESRLSYVARIDSMGQVTTSQTKRPVVLINLLDENGNILSPPENYSSVRVKPGVVYLSGEESYDLDNDIVSYQWDNGFGSGQKVSKLIERSGSYNVTLTVTDSVGNISKRSIIFYVEDN